MAAASLSSSSSMLEWPGEFVFDPVGKLLVIDYLHPKAIGISYCECPEEIPNAIFTALKNHGRYGRRWKKLITV
nr:hypothetical protein CFP56_63282 [Quercus suber]